MPKGYYYRRGNQIYGPVDSSQLRALAAEGKLQPTDAIRREDQSQWHEADRIRGLLDALPRAAGESAPPRSGDETRAVTRSEAPRDGGNAREAEDSKRFCVECADRETGEIEHRLFHATDEADAARQATERGFLAGNVEMMVVPSRAEAKPLEPTDGADRATLGLWMGLLISMGLAGVSALMPWVKIFAGGMAGIEGDGKIVLAVSLAVGLAVGLACLRPASLAPAASAGLAWGIVLGVWMSVLVYQVATVTHDPNVADNPFATAFATQITPGEGLYLGLTASVSATVLGTLLSLRVKSGASSTGAGRWRWPGTGAAVGVGLACLVAFFHLGLGADEAAPFDGIRQEASPTDLGGDSLFDVSDPTQASEDADARQADDGEAHPDRDTEVPPNRRSQAESDEASVALTPTLLNKGYDDTGTEPFVWMDIEWDASGLERPVEAVKGVLRITDVFDETRVSIGWMFTEEIEPDEHFEQEGVGFRYNRFMADHQWVRSTEVGNMRLTFEPEAVIFADGSTFGVRPEPEEADLLRTTVTEKRISESNFEEHVWFDIEWDTSGLSQPTRAVKGTFVIADVFGNPELRLRWTIEEPLDPGEQYREEGVGFRYNRFTASHRRVRTADLDNLRFYFIPDSVLYRDGRQENF